MKVLVVEDDARLRGTLEAGLRDAGFTVHGASDGVQADDMLWNTTVDVVVLDILLPAVSGLDLCAALRARNDFTPVLFLTALGTQDDRLEGFRRGGDDYLTKPFSFPELVARVRALGRRPRIYLSEVRQVADLTLDAVRRRVRRGTSEIDLSAQEFTLLEFLIRYPDRVVGRAEITSYVWDDNHDPFGNLLEVLVWRLRRKIDDGFEPKLLHTVRGSGYRLGLP